MLGGVAGPHAAPFRGRLAALVPGASCGSTAATIPRRRALAAALADLNERVSRPLVLIVGMLATKDCEGFLRNFAGLARRLFAVPLQQEKSLPAEAVASAARAVGIPADSFESVEAALTAIGRLDFDPAPRVLITGSLYLAGDTLAANGTLPI